MKSDQIYEELKNLAEKLNITVSEQNFRNTNIKVKSGLCKVNGRNLFIMDKHEPINKKNEILTACLSEMPHEHIFVVPALRELIGKYLLK